MDASICIWGGDTLNTKIDVEHDSHSVFFFEGNKLGGEYLRVFMNATQLLALRDRLNAISEGLEAEAQAEAETLSTPITA